MSSVDRSFSRCALWLVPAVCVLASCSTVQLNPSVFEKRTFALVSLTGDRTVASRNLATVGLAKMSGNAWGVKLTQDLVEEARTGIAKAVGAEVLPLEKVVAAPGYDRLPALSSSGIVGARPLRPLDLSREHDVALGRFAAALGVDAVVAVANEYTVVTDRDSARQRAEVEFSLVVVSADGTRLWEQAETLQSPPAEQTLEQRSRENVGVVSDEVASALCRQAVKQGLDLFAAAWSEKAGQHRGTR